MMSDLREVWVLEVVDAQDTVRVVEFHWAREHVDRMVEIYTRDNPLLMWRVVRYVPELIEHTDG